MAVAQTWLIVKFQLQFPGLSHSLAPQLKWQVWLIQRAQKSLPMYSYLLHHLVHIRIAQAYLVV